MSEELSQDVLGSMTLSRLYELAREHDVKNPRKYKKQELIDMILGAGQKSRAKATPLGPSMLREPQPEPRGEALSASLSHHGATPGVMRVESVPASAQPRPKVEPVIEKVYGNDFTPPSKQRDESDYIEDDPPVSLAPIAPRAEAESHARPSERNDRPERNDRQDRGDRGDRGERPDRGERGAYPSSQYSNNRQQRRQSRYDDRDRGRGPSGPRPGDGPRPPAQQPLPQQQQQQMRDTGLSSGATRDLENTVFTKGVLEIIDDANYGFIRQKAFHLGDDDIYVSMSQIKKFNLRTGDMVEGYARQPREQERYQSLVKIERINDADRGREHAPHQLREADAGLPQPAPAARDRGQGDQHAPDRPLRPDRPRHARDHRRQAQGGQDGDAEEDRPCHRR